MIATLSDPTLVNCFQSLDDPFFRVLPEHVELARRSLNDHLSILADAGVGEGKKNLIASATLFDLYAKLTLKGAGCYPSRTKIADLLGEPRSSYTAAVKGNKCSVQRIFAWSARWDIAAPPLLVRTVTPSPLPPTPPRPQPLPEEVVTHRTMSRGWFDARGCPLPAPDFQSGALYDARVEEAYVAVGRARVEKDVAWAAFRRSRIFLLDPIHSQPAKAFQAASEAVVAAQRDLDTLKQERTLFREEARRAATSSSEPVVNSRPSLAGLAEMEATARELVGCYKQIIYAPSLELEFLVETARRYDALARALLHREGRDERQRYIAYLVGERGAEYLSVIFGKLASREHLLRWWSNWPLFTLDAEEKVEFLPVPSR
jgi:hypothetical protein